MILRCLLCNDIDVHKCSLREKQTVNERASLIKAIGSSGQHMKICNLVMQSSMIIINQEYGKHILFEAQLRPYILERTRSRLISEVKLVMAQLVLWWVTTWEY